MKALCTMGLFTGAFVCWHAGLLLAEPETDASRELKQLQAQRDKAIASAMEPINARFQQSLEALSRRALQANDVATALAIKEVISTLPHIAAQELAGQWKLTASTGYTADVTLRADGSGTRSDGGRLQWHIEGTMLYLDPKSTADKFQLPIKDGMLKGVNNLGNGLTLTKKK